MENITSVQNSLSRIYERNLAPHDCIREYRSYIQTLIEKIKDADVIQAATLILEARIRGAAIYFAGNGGSASTASHFAQDLAECARRSCVLGFRAISLTDNVSYMTAIANDFGYEKIFTGQMENLFKEGDILVVISASGNSPNLIAAVEMAKARRGIAIGFLGFNGGRLAQMVDRCIQVETPIGEYGPVESVHGVIMHMMTSFIQHSIKM